MWAGGRGGGRCGEHRDGQIQEMRAEGVAQGPGFDPQHGKQRGEKRVGTLTDGVSNLVTLAPPVTTLLPAHHSLSRSPLPGLWATPPALGDRVNSSGELLQLLKAVLLMGLP